MNTLVERTLLYGPSVALCMLEAFQVGTAYYVRNGVPDNYPTVRSEFPELYARIHDLKENIYIAGNHRGRSERIPGKYSASHGYNFSAEALALVNRDLYAIDADAFKFLIKHEVGHIYYNTAFKASSIPALVALVAAIVLQQLSQKLPLSVALVASIIPALLVLKMYGHIVLQASKQADLFASTHSTNDELKGASRFFRAELIAQKEYYGIKPEFDSDGENTREKYFPKLNDRLKCISDELTLRKIETSDKETEIFEKLIAFHKKSLA